MMLIDLDAMCAACESQRVDADGYYVFMGDAFREFEIDNPKRVAAFLAQVTVESMNFRRVEEDLHYRTPERLHQVFPRAFPTVESAMPYVGRPQLLSQLLYEGYHGRGLIQLTWKQNYIQCAEALDTDFVNHPDWLLKQGHATRSAAWYFRSSGCNLAADMGDIDGCTRRVNGPAMMHASERRRYYHRVLGAIDA